MKALPFILLLGVGLAGLLYIFFPFGADKDAFIPQMQADLFVSRPHLRYGGQGKMSWALQAISGLFEESSGLFVFQQPEIIFTDIHNSTLQVRAPKGKFNRGTGQAELWDGVQAHWEQIGLTAQRLVYHKEQQIVVFENDVVAEQEKLKIKTNRLSLDLGSGNMQGTGQVLVEIYGHSSLLQKIKNNG